MNDRSSKQNGYAELVCGSVDNVRRLFATELRRRRQEQGWSPEDLDRILGFGLEWPSIREIEGDVSFFTRKYYDRLVFRVLEEPQHRMKLFELGDGLEKQVDEYLADASALKRASTDYVSSITHSDQPLFAPDTRDSGEDTYVGTPINLLSAFVFSRILKEIEESDRKN